MIEGYTDVLRYDVRLEIQIHSSVQPVFTPQHSGDHLLVETHGARLRGIYLYHREFEHTATYIMIDLSLTIEVLIQDTPIPHIPVPYINSYILCLIEV